MNGKRLIDLGYEPAAWFKEALAICNDDMTDEEVRSVCDPMVPQTLPLTDGFPAEIYLTPETDEERQNFEGVVSAIQELTRVPPATVAMVMPDACPAGVIPVGGVVASSELHPGWHSADVCCSVMASVVNGLSAEQLLDEVQARTHFGAGGRAEHRMSDELEERFRSNPFLEDLVELGHWHMGTQGDGNHFSFVGHDDDGRVNLVTHHGSRGVGAALYKKGMKVAEGFRRALSPDTPKGSAWIPSESPEGAAYWEALQVVKDWTWENHRALHDQFDAVEQLWTIHNFVFEQEGRYWHAKGATPSNGPALLPLNMDEPVYVVEDSSVGWLPHGAGRNMSRTAFKRLGDVKAPSVDVRFWLGHPDTSEFPGAYKPAAKVLEELKQHRLGRVTGQIRPHGTVMAGDRTK